MNGTIRTAELVSDRDYGRRSRLLKGVVFTFWGNRGIEMTAMSDAIEHVRRLIPGGDINKAWIEPIEDELSTKILIQWSEECEAYAESEDVIAARKRAITEDRVERAA